MSSTFSPEKPFFLDLSKEGWVDFFANRGIASFHADQVLDWIGKKAIQPEDFSNVSKSLRSELKESVDWDLPAVDKLLTSSDGSQRFLIRLKDSLWVESVLIPTERRLTLCLSSQVGCKMGCTFCQTGKLGLKRNLSAGEILSQFVLASKIAKRPISHVVFMGMGEPLDNFEELIKACRYLIDIFSISAQCITVSTSGLVPQIERLGKELPVQLAISLHTPFEEERSEMMPINRTYPLSLLKETLLRYPLAPRQRIFFEYVMIEGKNDSLKHAKELVRFLHGLRAKVNLIPMNPFPGNPMTASSLSQLKEFQEYLELRSISAPIRFSKGQDISAACGQLALKKEQEIHLDPREVAKARRAEWREESINAEPF